MIDYSHLTYRVEPMTLRDLDAIMKIELVSFTSPWSARAYDYEIQYNEMAHYYVVRAQDAAADAPTAPPLSRWQRFWGRAKTAPVVETPIAPLVGYAGFWLMVDEAHISTIATDPAWRRRSVGELLLIAMIDGAAEIGARIATLEVRVSSDGAQALYRKYGFEVVGTRHNYYSDNGEDALIMTTPAITSAEYQQRIQKQKDALYARLSR